MLNATHMATPNRPWSLLEGYSTGMAVPHAATEVVAIYGRASLDKKELRISTSRQIDRGRTLAEQAWPGCQIIVYEDNNLSASNPDVERPAYRRLLSDIRQNRIGQLVAHEQSRLTRQPAQWDELVVALSRAGIDRVHTVLRGQVPVTEGNRLVGRLMAVVDADESERLRLRALAMHDHLAASGRPNGGRYYGYRRRIGDDSRPRLAVYEPEAQVVHRIVDGLLAGRSAAHVADALNRDGIPPGKGGRRWWGQTVLGVARRPHIAGLRSFHRQVVGDGLWEPIIDRDRWEILQSVINSDPRRGSLYRPRRWLLTGGLAVCGVCGDPMITNKQARPHGNIDAYVCTPRARGEQGCGRVSIAPAQIVEELVVAAALEVIESPGFAARLAGTTDGGERAVLVERTRAAQARVDRAAELFGAGEVDEVTWRRMHAPAAGIVAEGKARLAELAGRAVDLPALGEIRADWDGLTVVQRRQAVGLAVARVMVLPRTGRRPADHRVRIRERLDIVWRI